jgi:hypothetical protein
MPIRAEGKFTVADIFRSSWRRAWKSILFLTIIGLGLLVEGAFLSLAESEEGWRGQWYLFALGIFLIVYLWPFIYYRAWRQVRRTPNLQGIVRYEFGEDGYLMTATHSNSTADIKWISIAKWKEGKYSFVIFANANFGNLIPKRFFQSAADVDAVRGLLQTKVKKK